MRNVTVYFVGLLVCVWLATAVSSPLRAETPFPVPIAKQVVPNPITVSPVDKKADTPVIAQAPNGTLMIVYNQWDTNDNNPDASLRGDAYYSVSTNNGQTWSTAQPIATSPNNRTFVTVVYDNSNVAHAAWIETDADNKSRLWYANTSGVGWSPPKQVGIDTPFPSFGVAMAVSRVGGVDRIEIVWDYLAPGNDRIVKHARVTGPAWTPSIQNDVTGSGLPLIRLEIAADSSGNLHLVSQVEDNEIIPIEIYYTRLNVGETQWKPLVQLSTGDLSDKSYQPDVAVLGNRVYVSMGYRVGDGQNAQQAVYLRECNLANNTSCTSIVDWTTPANISGQFVTANQTDPFYISTDLAVMPKAGNRQASLFLHFHGILSSVGASEVVWRTESCANWAQTPPEQLTNPATSRAINPSAVAKASGSTVAVRTAYEGVNPTDSTRRIYYITSTSKCGQIFLPFIQK